MHDGIKMLYMRYLKKYFKTDRSIRLKMAASLNHELYNWCMGFIQAFEIRNNK